MKKGIIVIGLIFCATITFAQSSCDAVTANYMYEKYRDVFENNNFSKPYWKNDATNDEEVEARKSDLEILANKLAKKLGIGNIPLEYLRDKDGNVVGYLKDENGNTIIIAGKYNSSSGQILINKIYLEKASADEMIKTVAEEVYHACQYKEVTKYINNGFIDEHKELWNQYNTAKDDTKEKAEAKSRIENFEKKQEIIKEWERDFKSNVYKEMEEYYQAITNNPNLANNPELIKLQTRGKREALEAEYNKKSLEQDAKGFRDNIYNVYNSIKKQQ